MSRGSDSAVSGSSFGTSAYESPSALARSSRFDNWALGAGILHVEEPSEASKLMFEKLCEFRLPKSFLDLSWVTLRNAESFYSKLKSWATSNPKFLVDNDVHHISQQSQILCSAHLNVCISAKQQGNQRRGVDQIIELAFESQIASVHDVLLKPDLRLCASESENFHVGANAVSDTLVVLPISAHLRDGILLAMNEIVEPHHLSNIYASAFWSKDVSDDNSVIVFASEYQNDSEYQSNDDVRNGNQLAMDLGTAQLQRHALGLKSAIIWGARCARSRFDVFSSELVNDHGTISYTYHHTWDLLDPVDFVKCYSFLCNLAGATATLLEGMDARTIAQSVVSASWRASILAPPPTAGSSKRKRPDSESNGAYGPPVRGRNSDGVDDLEPEEAGEWHKSVKDWQLEQERLAFKSSKFNLPLEGQKLQPTLVYDGEHGLRSVVEEWSANIL